MKFSEAAATLKKSPALGQNQDEILASLGMTQR